MQKPSTVVCFCNPGVLRQTQEDPLSSLAATPAEMVSLRLRQKEPFSEIRWRGARTPSNANLWAAHHMHECTHINKKKMEEVIWGWT